MNAIRSATRSNDFSVQPSGTHTRKIGLIVMFWLVVGCTRGPQFASVDGVVKLDGKPLASIEVQFIPDITQGASGPPASAYTDKEGRYRIEATGTSGVVVGKNRIRLNDATIMMPGSGVDAESGVAAPGMVPRPRVNRVPPIYSEATRSPLGVIEIHPGSQTHNLDLKSRQ